jgi:hypothetical protein
MYESERVDVARQGSDVRILNPPPTRMTVGAAQNETSQLIVELLGMLNSLEERLRPILSPSSPSPSGSGAEKPRKDPSSVLETVDLHNHLIRSAIGRVNDIGQRVEL